MNTSIPIFRFYACFGCKNKKPKEDRRIKLDTGSSQTAFCEVIESPAHLHVF